MPKPTSVGVPNTKSLDPIHASQKELDRINAMLSEFTPYRLGIAPPDKFHPAEINAHYMDKNTYDQLVENIRADGNLSSLPFCWHDKTGKLHTLSGHHRIEAAQDAGVKAVLYLFTNEELNEARRTAIQLAHNRLVGEDDVAILRKQWQILSGVQEKIYSGFDDKFFDSYQPVKLQAFSEHDLTFRKIELLFLVPELTVIKEAIDKIGKSSRVVLLGSLGDYQAFSEAIMRLKDQSNIFNTSTVFRLLIAIAEEYCDFLENHEDPDWPAIHAAAQEKGFLNADEEQ